MEVVTVTARSSFNSSHTLANRLRAEFARAEKARRHEEVQWIEDLCQYKGVLRPEGMAVIGHGQMSDFVQLTRAHVRFMDAWMHHRLLSEGAERHFRIQPLGGSDKASEEWQPFAKETEACGVHATTGSERKTRRGLSCAKRAARMETLIDDQLETGGYRAKLRQILHSGHVFGTGILKGPVVDAGLPTGAFSSADTDGRNPHFDFVPVWDVYPDPDAADLRGCEFIWQRHVMTRQAVCCLAGQEGFDSGAILRYLSEHPYGDVDIKYHEKELRAAGGAGNDVVDQGHRYEVLERWGVAEGRDLMDNGVKLAGEGRNRLFQAMLWLLGDVVIKAVIVPFGHTRPPYHFYYYEKDETSIFGSGMPRLMRAGQCGRVGSVVDLLQGLSGIADQSALGPGKVEEPPQAYAGLRRSVCGVLTNEVLANVENGVTWPFITAMCDWNIQFSRREDIKGAFRVVPKVFSLS